MRAATQLALVILLFSPYAAGQEKPNHAPAVVSADALEYGAELEEHAADELLEWASEYVEDELRWHQPDLKGTVNAVQDAFPSRNSTARDTLVYLVLYLAYEDQRELEDSFARQLHQYDNEMLDIRDELERWQRFGAPPPNQAPRPSMALTPSRQVSSRVARLHELETKSRLRGNQLLEIRERVNFYLKVLNAAYPHFKDVTPETLDSLTKSSPPPA